MEFTISSGQIIWVCAFVSTLWGVWKIMQEIKKPTVDLKRTVQKHDELIAADNERLKEIEDSNRMILQVLLVLINHDITGNGIDKMKSARDELQEFLINK